MKKTNKIIMICLFIAFIMLIVFTLYQDVINKSPDISFHLAVLFGIELIISVSIKD